MAKRRWQGDPLSFGSEDDSPSGARTTSRATDKPRPSYRTVAWWPFC